VGGGTDDHYGHGQHVAGIIAGNGARSSASTAFLTFRGLAPSANLINLRVLDQNGRGTDSTVIAAIQQAIKLKDRYNIRVINLSLGRPVFESYTLDPLCQAVEQAWKAGIVVVVAAGNRGRDDSQGTSGYATVQAPGNDPYVITVGAMKTLATPSRGDDLIASYSSKGPTLIDHIAKPDLVAPGNRVVSLLASTAQLQNQYPGNAVPLQSYENTGSTARSSDYYTMSGTSMATPMVSGAVALLLQQNPDLSPDQVKARLMKTATKSFPSLSIATDPTTGLLYTSQYDIFTVGAGYLDVWAALNNTEIANGTALSPTAQYDSSSGRVYVAFASNSVWGSNVAWRSNVVWGSNVFLNASNVV
jgi:serine protease AprX